MAALLLVGIMGVSGLYLTSSPRATPTLAALAKIPTVEYSITASPSPWSGPTYSDYRRFSTTEAILAEEYDSIAAFVAPSATETPKATVTATPPSVVAALPPATANPPTALAATAEQQLAQAVTVAEAPRFVWFVNAPIAASNPFSNWHNGVDVNVPTGTEVYAIAGGYTYCEANVLGCGQININHGDGYISLYGHVDTQYVNCGQWVAQGQLIGLSGTLTCVAPGVTYPHAHLTVLYNERLIDPMSLYGPS